MDSNKVIKAILSLLPGAKCTYWETKYNGDQWSNPIDGLEWFDDRQKPTWKEIEDQIIINDLFEAKENKLKELNNYYDSDECWKFKVVAGNASITKTCDWFGRMIPACAGQQLILFTDSGQTVSFNLSQEIGQKLNYRIQGVVSFQVKQAKLNCENLINACQSEEALNLIDIKAELGVIPRVIDLTTL